MEMDRQTLMVLFGAIIGLTLLGTSLMAGPPQRDLNRPVYSKDDIRYQYQKDELKDSRKGKKSIPVEESDTPSDEQAADSETEESDAEEPPIE